MKLKEPSPEANLSTQKALETIQRELRRAYDLTAETIPLAASIISEQREAIDDLFRKEGDAKCNAPVDSDSMIQAESTSVQSTEQRSSGAPVVRSNLEAPSVGRGNTANPPPGNLKEKEGDATCTRQQQDDNMPLIANATLVGNAAPSNVQSVEAAAEDVAGEEWKVVTIKYELLAINTLDGYHLYFEDKAQADFVAAAHNSCVSRLREQIKVEDTAGEEKWNVEESAECVTLWMYGVPRNLAPSRAWMFRDIANFHNSCISRLQERVKSLRQLNMDACEDDTAIRTLAQPFLGDRKTFGDSYGVPTPVDLVEELVKTLVGLQEQIKTLEKTLREKDRQIRVGYLRAD